MPWWRRSLREEILKVFIKDPDLHIDLSPHPVLAIEFMCRELEGMTQTHTHTHIYNMYRLFHRKLAILKNDINTFSDFDKI